ncbi:MAG: DUF1080 domain-containing protein [Verrucomicrobiales bacterium]|nr:DUF1080 domain-containing protein [Verrucomicrobiales bacterium]
MCQALCQDNPIDTVEVQDTTLGTDIVSRYHCNTWEEVLANGGAPFDVIVIGAGMFGAYCAEKIYRYGEKKANENPDWITITIRGIGEMTGDKNADPAAPDAGTKSWMNLAFDVPDQRDQLQARRAWANLVKSAADDMLWTAMEEAAVKLARRLANLKDPATTSPGLEFLHPGAGWKSDPPAKFQDNIGTTHHETGTLWMGNSGGNPGSALQSDGRGLQTRSQHRCCVESSRRVESLGNQGQRRQHHGETERYARRRVAEWHRRAKGFIALQNHHAGSKVQFRNIRIKA